MVKLRTLALKRWPAISSAKDLQHMHCSRPVCFSARHFLFCLLCHFAYGPISNKCCEQINWVNLEFVLLRLLLVSLCIAPNLNYCKWSSLSGSMSFFWNSCLYTLCRQWWLKDIRILKGLKNDGWHSSKRNCEVWVSGTIFYLQYHAEVKFENLYVDLVSACMNCHQATESCMFSIRPEARPVTWLLETHNGVTNCTGCMLAFKNSKSQSASRAYSKFGAL